MYCYIKVIGEKMNIAVELPNDNVAEKVLWFLEHLKDEGVKVFQNQKNSFLDIEMINEDEEDYQLYLEAKKRRENGEKIYSLDDILKEY